MCAAINWMRVTSYSSNSVKVYEGTMEEKRGESSWTYQDKLEGGGENCWEEIRPHEIKNIKGGQHKIRKKN